MLRVSNLFLKNIGPFHEQLFDFSIKKGHPDIHIFTGPNGTGKTSILHTLASSFDLFPDGHKTSYTTNFLHKRFNFFQNYSLIPKSYAKVGIRNRQTNEVIDKPIIYACKDCHNLHKAYDRLDDLPHKGINALHLKTESEELSNYEFAMFVPSLSSEKLNFGVFGYSGYRFINSTNIQFNSELNFNPLHFSLDFEKKIKENANISNWIISRYSKAAIEETHGNIEIAKRYKAAFNCLIQGKAQLTNKEFTFEIQTNPWKVVTKYFNREVEFDVLPDGLRSILSWLGDLLMRLDEIPWANKEIPVNEQDIILLLDEIEVHLHPKWQYQILPLTRSIFPNAQIFLSTHSPFVLNSIDNAKIYKLATHHGQAVLENTYLSNTGDSYSYIFENILDTTHRFGPDTTKDIRRFNEIDQEIVRGNFKNEAEFKTIINRLKKEGEEVTTVISSKLFRLKDTIGKDYLNGKNF